ncbi:GNAT family N-acetyltransferase [Tissierella sp. MB52-C2]|uniref:GNAT family N-acetyltransferase n=1 Tax=Tissierella sp. MB52-C2 TaxID=3070999 RepID=UPI00280A6108|nr:GNAT family N-acetyltransferase [Tissierella sp. MB52-C2]WMM23970.1 GNAT family N-acetyltransferase [Tissierella sp. MB52-C2]
MNIQISIVPYEDKTILYNLIQLYRYDSSEFDGHVLNKHGFYLYKYLDSQWTEDYRRPFIVKVDDEIAGFAFVILDVPKEFTILSSAEKTNVISDFFIMRKYKRKGVGKKLAFSLFDQFPGTWEIKQTTGNKIAYQFWRKVISEYTGSNILQEKNSPNEKWNGTVIVFKA